jgi:hypothetical protein
MPDTIRPLDFDALVEKHVRLSPAIRFYQLKCLVLGFVPLLIVAFVAIMAAIELLVFAIWNVKGLFTPSPFWQLDFHLTRDQITDLLFDKHNLGWLIPGTIPQAMVLGAVSLLHVYATVSFISLRLTVAAYGAIGLLWAQSIGWLGERTWSHLQGWQLAPTGSGWSAPTFQAEGLVVMDLWAVAIYCCLIYLVVRSLKIHRAMSREERAIIRDGRAASVHVSNLLQAFGIPMNIRNASRRARTAAYCYLGNLVGLFPPIALWVAGGLAYPLFMLAVGPYLVWDWYNPATFALAEEPIFLSLLNAFLVVIIIAIAYALMMIFRVVGNLCIRRSRRFLRVSLEQAQAADRRRPVLFLRSFRDDAVTLPPPKSGFAYKLLNYTERKKSLDQLLLEEGTSVGPVVALGNPADAVPPYGAARAYFHNDNWQKMIGYLMEQAVVIVICVDNSKSLWWEIESVKTHRHLSKTVFLLHPKYGGENPAPDIIRDLEKVLGQPLHTDVPGQKLLGGWLDETSRLHVGVASRFTRAHYLLMLRWFLRSKMDDVIRPMVPGCVTESLPGR